MINKKQEVKKGWEERFDETFGIDGDGSAGCDGCFSNEKTRAEHKVFIRQLLAKNIEHCSEPECPECNVAAYEAGRKAVVEEIRNQMQGLKKIMYNQDSAQHIRNIERNETIAKVEELLSKLTNEK